MPRRPKLSVVPATPAVSPNPTPSSPPTEPDSPATEAVQILRKLVDGIDPISNTPLPDESPYQSARVLRALQLALERVTRTAMKKAKSLPAAAGTPWSEEEDSRLAKAYVAGESLSELARAHQRTYGAIISRLVQRGLVAPSGFRHPQPSRQFQAKRQSNSSINA
jgi:hypothetical protein